MTNVSKDKHDNGTCRCVCIFVYHAHFSLAIAMFDHRRVPTAPEKWHGGIVRLRWIVRWPIPIAAILFSNVSAQVFCFR